MPYLIGIILVGLLVRQLMQTIAKADPAKRSAFAARAAGLAVLLLATFSLITGKLTFAAVIAAIGFWILGRGALAPGLARMWKSKATTGISRMRSAMIEVEIEQASNQWRGTVLAGEFVGQQLNDLARAQCFSLYASALYMDGGGARLLEAYFDRRFPGWRATGQRQGDAGTSERNALHSGAMSKDEAYEVLGLRKGASRDDIVRAHRMMMKKWHPDTGGATDVAARINEAKDLLLRLHQ